MYRLVGSAQLYCFTGFPDNVFRWQNRAILETSDVGSIKTWTLPDETGIRVERMFGFDCPDNCFTISEMRHCKKTSESKSTSSV
jgi:hypothetical protein